MKIIAIIGSPKKGNTYSIIKVIEEQLLEITQTEFECILLNDAHIENCVGCFNCVQNGHEYCPLKDDIDLILAKIQNANGVIFASPAYNFNVTAIMKNFIDRLAYNGHRPQFFSQDLMIVATAAGTGTSEVIGYLEKFVGKLWGFKTITKLEITTLPNIRIIITKDIIKKIGSRTQKYIGNLNNRAWHPSYHHIDQFNTMRSLWSLEKMKNSFPKDYAYYQSLKNDKFYIDTKVNVISYYITNIKAKLLGKIFERVL
jgi:multimeric flavodoxin WrbA